MVYERPLCSVPTTTEREFCYFPEWIGDGLCDDSTNIAACNYDGGDCCLDPIDAQHCGQCICKNPQNITYDIMTTTYTTQVHCLEPHLINNGVCDLEVGMDHCFTDGKDCSKSEICLFSSRRALKVTFFSLFSHLYIFASFGSVIDFLIFFIF